MDIGRTHIRFVIAVLAIYALLQLYCIRQLSVNYDEASFYLYGVTLWKGVGEKDVQKFDSKLPVTALNVLPRVVEQLFHPGLSKSSPEQDILRGRYISLLASILLGLLLFRWAHQLYGSNAAVVTLLLYLLCPNFLAHGIFVSSDIFATLFMTASLYGLWTYHTHHRLKDCFFSALALGCALASKFSMVHLVLIVGLLQCIYLIRHRRQLFAAGSHWGTALRPVGLFLVTIWLVLAASHLFHGIGIPLGRYTFRSSALLSVQHVLHGVGDYLPVLLPEAYVKGLDAVMYYDSLGGGMPGSLNGATYLLGDTSSRGFPYYYGVVLFFKLPLASLGLLALSIILYVRTRPAGFWQREVYLCLPACYYLVYLNLFYSTQIGIRHILMVLPLLYLFTGYGISKLGRLWQRGIAYALLLFQCISVASYFPHFLPYTNEMIGDKKMAFTKIADTNLCYGEGQSYLREYLRQHPEAVYLPAAVQPGKVVMEVNEMLDHNIQTAGRYHWVRGLVPSGHIHSQYLIFDISPATADSLKKRYPQ